MKKYLLLLPTVVFPYCILFAVYCIFSGFLMERVFRDNAMVLMGVLVLTWVIAAVFAVLFLILGLSREWDARELVKVNMVIKLIHVPAYIGIFLIGCACLITIFTAGISLALALLDSLAIILSGMVGLTAAIRSRAGYKLALLQFIFCADVIGAVLLYKKK